MEGISDYDPCKTVREGAVDDDTYSRKWGYKGSRRLEGRVPPIMIL